MLIVGSVAARVAGLCDREPADWDAIMTIEEFRQICKEWRATVGIRKCVPLSDSKWHVLGGDGLNRECEIAWPGSSGARLLDLLGAGQGVIKHAPGSVLYALKMSHRYLRNSPHFLKTMRDIQRMRTLLTPDELSEWTNTEWFKQREAETYVYAHPKLDVSKQDFFDDSVGYIYDHDSIHLTQALISGITGMDSRHPAYTFYMQDGAQVMTDKEKFFSVDEEIRLFGVYEEACVLALERSQIPNNFEGPSPRWSFTFALQKVCTSITSGWFREFAWEHYDEVVALYEKLGENDYIERFHKNSHLLKPFRAGDY